MTGGGWRAFPSWKRLTGDADRRRFGGGDGSPILAGAMSQMKTDEEAAAAAAAAGGEGVSRSDEAYGRTRGRISDFRTRSGANLAGGDDVEDASSHLLAGDGSQQNEDRKEHKMRSAATATAASDWDDGGGGAPLTWQTVMELLLCILAFVGRGFCLNSLGPTLIDLRQLTHAPVEDSAVIFVSQSAGLFVGSLVAKIIFDRINHELAMAVALLLQALATAAVPFTSILGVMCFAFGCQGFCIGIVGIGVTTLCLELGGKKKNGMYLQAVYLGVSVGSIVGPFMAKPFLSVEAARQGFTKITDFVLHPPQAPPPFTKAAGDEHRSAPSSASSSQSVGAPAAVAAASTAAALMLARMTTPLSTTTGFGVSGTNFASLATSASAAVMQNGSRAMLPVNTTAAMHAAAETSYTSTQVAYDYYLIAAILAVPSVGFLVLFVLKSHLATGVTRRYCWVATASQKVSDRPSYQGSESDDSNTQHDRPRDIRCCDCQRCPPVPLLGFMALLFLQCLVFFGMQDSYSNLLTTFVVMSDLRLHKVRGVYATSTFWAAICFGRLNGIWVARFVSPFRMLLFDTVLAAAAATALLAFGQQNEYVLWVFSAALGLAFATVNAATVSWAATRVAGGIGRARGYLLTVIMVGRCTGLLTIPTAVAAVFRVAGAVSLMRALLVVTIVHLLCLVGSELIAYRCTAADGTLPGHRRSVWQRLREQSEGADAETGARDDLDSPRSRR